jgi:hypothetical protein
MYVAHTSQAAAQHSVHPLRHALSGSQGGLAGLPRRGVRVFEQFDWLEVGSGKLALSGPTHQRVTQTVRLLITGRERVP